MSEVFCVVKHAAHCKRLRPTRAGNVDEIYSQLTKGGTQLEGGNVRMIDGAYLNLHNSSTSAMPTISINNTSIGGNIYKIRVEANMVDQIPR